MDTVGGTILVAVILAAIVAAIIYKLVKDKKQGKSCQVHRGSFCSGRDKGKHRQDDSEAYRRGLYNQRALP